MDEKLGRGQLVQTGRELLEKGLVARTWGNISCRLDDESFLITPSGLDYMKTTDDDIVIYNRISETWEGSHKPSSEKGIHASAYELFPEVNFVIHTHQTYATALGLVGWDTMDITEEELKRLGGIARADYGLPGQKSLKNNVRAAMETGARTVFMVSHGVVICGTDKADAMEKEALLEEICKRNYKGKASYIKRIKDEEAQSIMDEVNAAYPNALLAHSDALVMQANLGKAVVAQLDDMAQMIGGKIPVAACSAKRIIKALEKHNAVLVPMLGAVVNGKDKDDSEALGMLAHKAAVSAGHTAGCKAKIRLPLFDVVLMNAVYNLKYSKQKG